MPRRTRRTWTRAKTAVENEGLGSDWNIGWGSSDILQFVLQGLELLHFSDDVMTDEISSGIFFLFFSVLKNL